MFKDKNGRNMEVYVDDMLVKSKRERGHVIDFEEAFEIVRTHNMIFNPTKCVSVKAGNFLGFMVTSRGIEVSLEKIWAIWKCTP